MLQQYPEYRKWMLLGLLVQLLAAWFSVGYNNPDEHFQVLEFCNYKLGFSPASALPWEFAAHCRSALLPLMAYSVCRSLQFINYFNPFLVGFLLRLATGIATWLLICRVVTIMLPAFINEKARLIYVSSSFLLWFIPYIGVRFSAENVAGLLFLASLFILPDLLTTNATKRTLKLIVAGLFLGFALFMRLQMAFAYAALCAWIIIYAKWPIKYWLILIFSGSMAIGLGILADRWLYGTWVFSPVNYYTANIIQHVAYNYGIFPWYYYFVFLFNYAVPPLSIALLPLFITGIWKNPKHLFSWICIAFVLGHILVSHKEMRFMFPILIPFVFLACKGLDALFQQYPGKKIYRWALPVLVLINFILLTVRVLIPAHEPFRYYSAIYDYAQDHPTTLICYRGSPYNLVGLEVNFYKSSKMKIEVVQNAADLNKILSRPDGRTAIFLNPNMNAIPFIAGCHKALIYTPAPDWLSSSSLAQGSAGKFVSVLYRLK